MPEVPNADGRREPSENDRQQGQNHLLEQKSKVKAMVAGVVNGRAEDILVCCGARQPRVKHGN